MWPRHRLDLGWSDLVSGAAGCVRGGDREALEGAVLAAADLTGCGLVTLSVRSGWDLLLSALDWAPGEEIVVTAITHPEMIAIIEAHELCAVPVEVDLDTLAPGRAQLDAALSPRTRAVLVAHLFGGRAEVAEIVAWAQPNGLLVVEDAAQAFAGPADLLDPRVDIALYSFGLIKTTSAAGGALVAVRDPALLARLGERHRTWPVQRRRSYAARLLKAAGLLLLSRPGIYGVLFAVLHQLGRPPDRLINSVTRSFRGTPADRQRLSRFRRQPSGPLLALMLRRLLTFDPTRLARRAALGERMSARLPANLFHPGGALAGRTHWLYPVVVADPDALVAQLQRVGVDASRGTSNLEVVASSSHPAPGDSAATMAGIVYLPVYPELPEEVHERILTVLSSVGAGTDE